MKDGINLRESVSTVKPQSTVKPNAEKVIALHQL